MDATQNRTAFPPPPKRGGFHAEDTVSTNLDVLLDEQTELTATEEDIHDGHITSRLVEVHTALPGIIQSYDSAKQTCTAQPALMRIFTDAGPQPLPVCQDVPVFFPGSCLTFDVNNGDDCLLCFSERCIDRWFGQGGVQEPGQYRMHDLSDGFAFVGFNSLPRGMQSIQSGVELRNRDGSTRIGIRGGNIILQTSGNICLGAATESGADLLPPVNGVCLATAIEPLTELTGFMLGWTSQTVLAKP
jgi:Phage protein Gp138 N-terminal domain